MQSHFPIIEIRYLDNKLMISIILQNFVIDYWVHIEYIILIL